MMWEPYPENGALFCIASRCVAEGEAEVGLMYLDESSPYDSGWHFFSGSESDWYLLEPGNTVRVPISDITDRDPELGALLGSPQGSRFERGPDGRMHSAQTPPMSSFDTFMSMQRSAGEHRHSFLLFLLKTAFVSAAVYFLLRLLLRL